MIENSPSFVRYLHAKKSVDDRALNDRVWQQFREQLRQRRSHQDRLQILEIGGGIGTMLTRLLDSGILPDCDYHMVDINSIALAFAPKYIEGWAQASGWRIGALTAGEWLLDSPHQTTHLKLVAGDIFKWIKQKPRSYDAMISHAVLDLFDLDAALPRLLAALKTDGLFYTTINYDGHTIFEPPVDAEFERQILARYNQSMDERMTDGKISGDSQSGRHLFGMLRKNQAEILSAGSSDWVLYAPRTGYAQSEAEFLAFLLGFIEGEMRKCPEIAPQRLEAWLRARREHIRTGELVCIVHQLDLLAIKRDTQTN